MMVYLDLQQSKKDHPNENWAREVMQLFMFGIGNYTEPDVKAAAAAFTGYRIDPPRQEFRFAAAQHDESEKTFLGHRELLRQRHSRSNRRATGLREIHRARIVAFLCRG